ncbi:hypothetical protein FA13DRAFT_1105368 [Coprinellus micaceus]|uniref:Uncharacterized protein n=1 Tax=Coprinellus micaceus TaxID=71717 RepID=A0A4Y7RKK6_COPMI|nr:hypothetical protein FA13DRAFT_1105368 [Coprinellus micaceus]
MYTTHLWAYDSRRSHFATIGDSGATCRQDTDHEHRIWTRSRSSCVPLTAFQSQMNHRTRPQTKVWDEGRVRRERYCWETARINGTSAEPERSRTGSRSVDRRQYYEGSLNPVGRSEECTLGDSHGRRSHSVGFFREHQSRLIRGNRCRERTCSGCKMVFSWNPDRSTRTKGQRKGQQRGPNRRQNAWSGGLSVNPVGPTISPASYVLTPDIMSLGLSLSERLVAAGQTLG